MIKTVAISQGMNKNQMAFDVSGAAICRFYFFITFIKICTIGILLKKKKKKDAENVTF